LNKCSDKNWWLEEKTNQKLKGRKLAQFQSIYLEMKDGIKIAMDISIPEKFYKNEKFPVVLHQTRYYRKFNFRFPFNLFLKQPNDNLKNSFIQNGYIWISIDARGSGASTGHRTSEWSLKELEDSLFIIDWISNQQWCDGNIGVTGISYSGTSAEFLSLMGHPSLKAASINFSLYDVYTDIAFPGGIKFKWFIEKWERFNKSLDTHNLPLYFSKLIKLLIKGVKPIGKDLYTLEKAKHDHFNNWNIEKEANSIRYRDEISDSGISIDFFSPHNFFNTKSIPKIPMLFISGWWDGAYQLSAIKKFNYYSNNKNKLILGPWDHGATTCICLNSKNKSPVFSFEKEILRFFDHHIRKVSNGLELEKPVHYYTIGRNVWKNSQVFPIENKVVEYFIHPDKSMFLYKPIQEEVINEIRFDYTHGTGKKSRWRSMLNPLNKITDYSKRNQQYLKNFTFKSLPVLEDLDVTGIPEVFLYLKSSEPDGHLHIYLDELQPNGKIQYITEGLLKLSMIKSVPKRKNQKVFLERNFSKDCFQPLLPGKIYEVRIQMYPISYTISKGSSILLSLAGSDIDNFESCKYQPIYDLLYGSKFPSSLKLPIDTDNQEIKSNISLR
jgi:uncharacterized protein